VLDGYGASVGALTGAGFSWGQVLGVAAAVGAVVFLASRRRVSPRLAGLVAAFLALWILTAATRAQYFNAAINTTRYHYLGVALLLLIAAQLCGYLTFRRAALVAVAVGATSAVLMNVFTLEGGGKDARAIGTRLRAELGALDIARAQVAPSFRLSDINLAITAGQYLAVRRDLGDPGFSQAELGGRDTLTKVLTDQVLVQALRIRPVPAGFLPVYRRPPAVTAAGATTASRSGCVLAKPSTSNPGQVDAAIASGTLFIRVAGTRPAEVRLRRFAAFPSPRPLATIAANRLWQLKLPRDGSTLPWIVALTIRAPTLLCMPV
jgi:hypothetical protein